MLIAVRAFIAIFKRSRIGTTVGPFVLAALQLSAIWALSRSDLRDAPS